MNVFENADGRLRQRPDHDCPRDGGFDGQAERMTPFELEGAEEPRDILHGLNNMLASILLNAQLIEWKLPSYSRVKRNVHEVERSAQRGAALVTRLRHWLESKAARSADQVPAREEDVVAPRRVGDCGEEGMVARCDASESDAQGKTADGKKVPHTMV